MSRFLARMAAGSRRRAGEAVRSRPLAVLVEAARSRPAPRRLSGFGATFDVVAEIKPRSPAVGALPLRQPHRQVEEYQGGGAAMLSVLTEPEAFGGSLELLESVASSASVPVMRKDFLVDPYQVYEARAAGADGVLLIGRLLDDRLLDEMLGAVAELGMFALLEGFDGDDMDRLAPFAVADRSLLGVNCRDLDTLRIVPARHEELASLIPPGAPTVAESAVGSPDDADRLARLGYRAVLVGTALMESPRPGDLVAALAEAGRRVVAVAG